MNTQLPIAPESKSVQQFWIPNPAHELEQAAGHQEHGGRILPIQFDTNSPADFQARPCPDSEAKEADEFEGLLVDILARFANLPSIEVDREIQDALNRVCDFLGFERAGLWRNSEDPTSFVLTHHWRCDPCLVEALDFDSPGEAGNPCGEGLSVGTVPLGAESKSYFPWLTAQAKRGKTISFARIADLPEPAAQDRETLSRLGARSSVFIPFLVGGEIVGAINFDTVIEERAWPDARVRRLEFVAQVFAQATARKIWDESFQTIEAEVTLARQSLAGSHAELKQLKQRLQAESEYVKADIMVCQAHGQIIGQSKAIKRVLHDVEQVAPADCPVLISGETGTGKELVAQEIHRLSARKDRAMVLVNCAALPAALVESELFGRERGAYTGALTSQVGRFELADGSTIFLDEVGELTMEVQAKLLRVLQQGEFQRLGSPKTYKVDVRVMAATNRDLAEEVRKGRFREDLYYRLRVFPIEIPPLRERVEDIPMLAFAFMKEFSTRMGKKITKLPRNAMEALQAHCWQGNIRELRNVIEHSVILTAGDSLSLTILGDAPTREAQPITLAEAEREHIVKALESTGWRIKGPHGAAVKLDLQPSTLYSRMQKLGIPHRRQKDEMAISG